MPLYSFDPGDDEQDWESELLEDQDGQPEKVWAKNKSYE